MATNVSTIGSGQDYTTVTAWEAAVQGDLVSAGDIEKGEMIDQVFDERVTIDGSTTDASNYLWLTVKAGNEHDGTAGGGPRIVPSSGTGHILTISDPYTRIEGIELDLSNTTGTSDECIRMNTTAVTLRKCLFHTGTARSQQDGIYVPPDTNRTVTVENCCFHGFGRAGIHVQNYQGSATLTANIRNCTVRNCAGDAGSYLGGLVGRQESNTTNMNVDNTIAVDNTSQGGEDFHYYNAANWAGDGNISSDTSCQSRFGAQTANLNSRTSTANASPGAGDWVIFVSITGGSEDYHLQSSAENDAEGNGISLSGNFTDDFDGDTRSDWDSGFDEIAAAPPATSRFLLIHSSLQKLGLMVAPVGWIISRRMRLMKMFLLVLLLWPTAALAIDIPLRWTGSTDADGYRITQSADLGATWVQVADVPHDGAVALDEQATTILGAPDTGLLLFRVASYNTVGETTRVEAGAWYNGDWDLPAAPRGMGVE